jgi:hypothetical protein
MMTDVRMYQQMRQEYRTLHVVPAAAVIILDTVIIKRMHMTAPRFPHPRNVVGTATLIQYLQNMPPDSLYHTEPFITVKLVHHYRRCSVKTLDSSYLPVHLLIDREV